MVSLKEGATDQEIINYFHCVVTEINVAFCKHVNPTDRAKSSQVNGILLSIGSMMTFLPLNYSP